MNTVTIQPNSVERHFKVSLGGDEKILPQSKVMEYADELYAKHGSKPTIDPLGAAELAHVDTIPAPPPTTPPPSAPLEGLSVQSGVQAGDIDESAKERIDAQQAILREAGLTGIGFKGEGGEGEQLRHAHDGVWVRHAAGQEERV
jgi:hypothetical protein